MTLLNPLRRTLLRPSFATLNTTMTPTPIRRTAFQPRLFTTTRPRLSPSEAEEAMTPAEASIAATLSSHASLQPTSSVLVRDVSGGCGSMYAIDISSKAFKGLNLLKQQRLVNKALGEQVKEWHGVQIRTSVPEE